MPRTFNREPHLVNLPSKNDVKNYFFNHNNWTGFNDDKNFVAVDQKSFSACKNVYVNEEGVLRSRPYIKIKDSEGNVNMSQVIDVWEFGPVNVYETCQNNAYYLTFVNEDIDYNVNGIAQMGLSGNYSRTTDQVKLIVKDRKIFVFEPNAFRYYDMNTNIISTAESYIYVPVTKVVTNGIEDDLESPNEMTSAYITRYIYDNTTDLSTEKFFGKTVTIHINNEDFVITFDENSSNEIYIKKGDVPQSAFSDFYTLGLGAFGLPLVQVQEFGDKLITLVCTVSIVLGDNSNGNVPICNWNMYWSIDNITFDKLPDTTGILTLPKISKDGTMICVLKTDGIYVISIFSNNESGTLAYSTWTKLSLGSREGGSSNLTVNINDISTSGTLPIFNQNVACGFDVYDNQNFVIAYGSTLTTPSGNDDYKWHACGWESWYADSKKPTSDNTQMFPLYNNITVVKSWYYQGATSIAAGQRYTYSVQNYIPYSNAIKVEYGYSPRTNSNTYCYVFTKVMTSTQNGEVIFYISDENGATSSTRPSINAYNILSGITLSDIYGKVILVPIASDLITWNNSILITIVYTYESHDTNNLFMRPEIYELTYFMSNNSHNALLSIHLLDEDTDLYNENTSRKTTVLPILIKLDKMFPFESYIINNKIVLHNNEVGKTINSNTYPIYINNSKIILGSINTFEDYERIFRGHTNGFSIYCRVITGSNIYENNIDNYTFYIDLQNEPVLNSSVDNINYLYPSHYTELENYYLSIGNKLYISKTVNSDDFKWYFPKINTENVEYDITNLHPISDKEVAVFQKHNIRYVTWDNDLNSYRYYKSRTDIGLEEGGDVLTTFDGKYTIFNTQRGLVAMSYQEFIASTEQSLTFISDNIYSHYLKYAISPIKLCKYGYWLFIYRKDSNGVLIFDFRTNSWWPLEYINNCNKFIVLDNLIKLLSNETLYDNLYDDISIYQDYVTGEEPTSIDWFIKSQKLHLDAVNNYKNILSLTLNNTFNDDVDLDDDTRNKKKMRFTLKVKLFRTDIGEDHYGSIVQKGYFSSGDTEKTISYDIDCISTFVQRVNFGKVIEFQYEIHSNNDWYEKIPLSLANITVKYKIGSEVR